MGKVDVFMSWFPADYLKKTLHLSLEEDAFYRRLLDQLWVNDGKVSIEQQRLMRSLRVSKEEFDRCKWILDDFFQKEFGCYVNKRLTEELKKAVIRKENAIENGKKGGRPASQNNPTLNPEITQPLSETEPRNNPIPNPERTQHQSSSSSSSSSSKKNKNAGASKIPKSEMALEKFLDKVGFLPGKNPYLENENIKPENTSMENVSETFDNLSHPSEVELDRIMKEIPEGTELIEGYYD